MIRPYDDQRHRANEFAGMIRPYDDLRHRANKFAGMIRPYDIGRINSPA